MGHPTQWCTRIPCTTLLNWPYLCCCDHLKQVLFLCIFALKHSKTVNKNKQPSFPGNKIFTEERQVWSPLAILQAEDGTQSTEGFPFQPGRLFKDVAGGISVWNVHRCIPQEGEGTVWIPSCARCSDLCPCAQLGSPCRAHGRQGAGGAPWHTRNTGSCEGQAWDLLSMLNIWSFASLARDQVKANFGLNSLVSSEGAKPS